MRRLLQDGHGVRSVSQPITFPNGCSTKSCSCTSLVQYVCILFHPFVFRVDRCMLHWSICCMFQAPMNGWAEGRHDDIWVLLRWWLIENLIFQGTTELIEYELAKRRPSPHHICHVNRGFGSLGETFITWNLRQPLDGVVRLFISK